MSDEPDIRAIIFSRDRAMQLDATLRSFFRHCTDASLIDMQVLYTTSEPRLERQYQVLAGDYPRVRFVREKNFHNDVMKWLDPYPHGSNADTAYARIAQVVGSMSASRLGRRVLHILAKANVPLFRLPEPTGQRYDLFLVDDNLFVRDFSILAAVRSLRENPEALGFSLRLGRNTSYCYMLDSPQAIPDFKAVGEDIVKYDWATAEFDFAYPLEVSSSVYRGRQMVPYMLGLPFLNPNTMESEMAACSPKFRQSSPMLLCFKASVTFCNPINEVQIAFPKNHAGENPSNSVYALADRFERGERIAVQVYDGFTPNACHQEVALVFGKAGGICQ